MIGEILGLVTDVMGMLSSSDANADYQAKLDKIKADQKLSSSALQAKALLGENATRGLAGYDTMKEDILSSTPTTLNESRDFLSGSGVVDFLAKSKAMTDQQLRQLNATNEQQKQTNMNTYANYLGGAMAGEENRLNAINTGLSMNQSNADIYNQAQQNASLANMATRVGKTADTDWAKIIGLLSKSEMSNPQGLAPANPPAVATFEDTQVAPVSNDTGTALWNSIVTPTTPKEATFSDNAGYSTSLLKSIMSMLNYRG
jgi:hypothetical protein